MDDKDKIFTFDIQLQDGYILAESSGSETVGNMLYVYENIIQKCIEWKCDRVLYIEDFSNQIPMEDMIIAWRKIFSLVEQNNINGRIAVIDRNKDDFSINMISESLAGAHGINAKVFSKDDEALAWLKSGTLN